MTFEVKGFSMAFLSNCDLTCGDFMRFHAASPFKVVNADLCLWSAITPMRFIFFVTFLHQERDKKEWSVH